MSEIQWVNDKRVKPSVEKDMVNHPPHYKDASGIECIEVTSQGRKDDAPKAVQILNEAVQIMAERGKSYDKSGGEAERSMPKIVAMFNALTGHELTPEQGWKFMCCLKLARSEQGEYREDNYLDGAAYMALAGEEASEADDD
ncbi:DUF6378 domain-containing protein [Psychrobacter sp. UBA2514]|jgi:hypothetical protein|uniref:DUF6378 domain-containing protein n=1 Tax=Psychrobacter sp. UBA2514 TaxID=1947346 RepID=UPI00257D73B2|nr:DUF6378 domain-containing protein [Psychrobacter sp. UBA2514]|tara:strand:- start:6730 stop:7155 length:426 start_codon:yes stop_codon:yes gene_type:complete